MKAFILAAGRGERMQQLTANCPKPLLEVNGYPLIEHQIHRLVSAGIQEIIINTAYLGHMIQTQIGSGERFGISITFSTEPEPLETAGAIAHAFSLLGSKPFLLVNSDVWIDLDYAYLLDKLRVSATLRDGGGHVVLVTNPAFKASGDFALNDEGLVVSPARRDRTYTFSGVSVLSPALIWDCPFRREKFALREVFDWAIGLRRLTGEHFSGYWQDVGTPERLRLLRQHVNKPGYCSSTPGN